MESVQNTNINKICPKCGSGLVHFKNKEIITRDLCTNSACRLSISNNKIDIMDLDEYSKIQDRVGFSRIEGTQGVKAYMLLKENLSAPLLVKNNSDVLDTERNTFCIVQAKDKDDAMRQFNKRFAYIKITDEMIVEIIIKEINK